MFLCLFLLLKCLFVCLWFCCIHGSQQFHGFCTSVSFRNSVLVFHERANCHPLHRLLVIQVLAAIEKKSSSLTPPITLSTMSTTQSTLYKLINHISQSISQNNLSNRTLMPLHTRSTRSTKWFQACQGKLQLFHSFLVDAKLFSVEDRGNIKNMSMTCLFTLSQQGWKLNKGI